MTSLHNTFVQLLVSFWITGGPRYSRGLRSQKVPRVPKQQITREHCMGKKSCFLRQNGQKSADNKGKFRGYQVLGIKNNPRIVKTANSKPANSEGRLYCLLFSFLILMALRYLWTTALQIINSTQNFWLSRFFPTSKIANINYFLLP